MFENVSDLTTMAAYLGAGACIGFGAIGAALGEGYTAGLAMEAISKNPHSAKNIIKNMLIGQAMAESAAIFALVIAILLLFIDISLPTVTKASSLLGAGFCMGLGAIGSGIGAGFPGGHACLAISASPQNSSRISTTMLIGSAVCQTPAIFAMVISFLLIFLKCDASTESTPMWAALLGSGACMGLGAIGSGIGSGIPGGSACSSIARQPELSGKITVNLLIGSAVSQTPAIFAMVISFLLMFLKVEGKAFLSPTWAALLSAGLCMGLGAIGSGIGSGLSAGACCDSLGRQPKSSAMLTMNMLIGSAVSQTPSIFALVISFLLLFLGFEHMPLSPMWAALIGAGLSTGLSAIGSGIGSGMASETSSEGIARNPETLTQVLTTMLVGQAVSQTPSIFGLLISFILIFRPVADSGTLSTAMALLSAGISMGFGGIGPGIGNGIAAKGAIRWIARNVQASAHITRTMLIGQAVSQSTATYALLISLVLIFIV